MTRVLDIIDRIHQIAPFDTAEKWDNSGLQVGSPDRAVKKVIIALDVTHELVRTAVKQTADLIITHHPLIMRPLKSLDFSENCGSIVYLCARNDLSIISAHTNLDKARSGLNDYFASKLGITIAHEALSEPEYDKEGLQLPGIGRIGSLEAPLELSRFVERVKRRLGLAQLRVTGDLSLKVHHVAVCTGSGGSLVDEFVRSGADVFVTGDVKYHEARTAEQYGKSIVDVGHFASEHIAIDLMYDQLSPVFADSGVDFIKYRKEKDPFTIV